jgi:hypothetical protein
MNQQNRKPAPSFEQLKQGIAAVEKAGDTLPDP